MSNRITKKDLEYLCDALNRATGSPMKPYEKDENGKFVSCPGNFHMGYAYGGARIERMATTGGGIETPVHYGYETKRDCWNLGQAYLRGLNNGR